MSQRRRLLLKISYWGAICLLVLLYFRHLPVHLYCELFLSLSADSDHFLLADTTLLFQPGSLPVNALLPSSGRLMEIAYLFE
jgi:hypothetical protein